MNKQQPSNIAAYCLAPRSLIVEARNPPIRENLLSHSPQGRVNSKLALSRWFLNAPPTECGIRSFLCIEARILSSQPFARRSHARVGVVQLLFVERHNCISPRNCLRTFDLHQSLSLNCHKDRGGITSTGRRTSPLVSPQQIREWVPAFVLCLWL